jgi:hypothetical protein
LEHDPDKWLPVFPRDKREAFARRSCSNTKIEHDADSTKRIALKSVFQRKPAPDLIRGGHRFAYRKRVK